MSKTLYDTLYESLDMMPTWKDFFKSNSVAGIIEHISEKLERQKKTGMTISPDYDRVFRAFMETPFNEIKSVILGQDPAPEPHLATGLSFSIEKDVSTSHVPSIQRVLLEMRNEGFRVDIMDGDLSPLAKKGVLLLNTVLTIPIPLGAKIGKIDGHKSLWMPFTRRLFAHFADYAEKFSFILWGPQAQSFTKYVRRADHLVIAGGHPSPKERSEDFFCIPYFLKTNEYLTKNGIKPIDWNLTENEPQDKRVGVWHWDPRDKVSVFAGPCPVR